MISRRSVVLTFLAAVSAAAVPLANPAPLADTTHAKEVEQWRVRHEASMELSEWFQASRTGAALVSVCRPVAGSS